MADEVKETTVTDSALDKASEETEVTEATPGQEPVADVSETQKTVEQTEKEKEEQRERSALGRKVKALEDKFDRFLEKADTYFQNPPQAQEIKSVFDSEDYLTVNKLEELLEYREGKKAQKQRETLKKYEDKYLDTFARLGADEKLDDDEFVKVDEIMRKSFNASYSNYSDPIADAERNFLKAMRAYEKGKDSKKSLNLKGDTPKGTSAGSGTKMVDKSIKMPELDEHARDFVNRYKIPEEKVAKVLDGEAPMSLKRRT